MKKLELVEEKGKPYKTYTVIFSVLLVLLSILEIIQPYLLILEPVIPTNLFPWISAILGIVIGVGRYIKQDLSDGKLDGKTNVPEGDANDHQS
jgi:hypothetical protein